MCSPSYFTSFFLSVFFFGFHPELLTRPVSHVAPSDVWAGRHCGSVAARTAHGHREAVTYDEPRPGSVPEQSCVPFVRLLVRGSSPLTSGHRHGISAPTDESRCRDVCFDRGTISFWFYILNGKFIRHKRCRTRSKSLFSTRSWASRALSQPPRARALRGKAPFLSGRGLRVGGRGGGDEGRTAGRSAVALADGEEEMSRAKAPEFTSWGARGVERLPAETPP